MRIIAAVVLAGAVASAQASLLQRPTTVRALLSGSPKLFDGDYNGTGIARMCGETDPLQSFTGERTFIVEYPLDYVEPAGIVDVRFTSKALVGGVKETRTFFVSVNVRQPSGGKPPAYVVDTTRANTGASGSALLTESAGTVTLNVKAVDQLGQSLDLSIVCSTRKL